MWRRAGPWSHAPGRCTSNDSDQPYDANKSNEPDDPNDTDESDESDESDELHYFYDSHDTGQ
ncbi:MAG TPA: hypothetical protein VN856_15085 [Mycobacterium sp.]|uniref:hypothetical protein n=1 Tax=Mycobacterium sp. TaxID=1785 RepID=UPI002C54DFA4|nr:hypothetical protein [Mycobacterium sp.]HXO81204.1 hypothetical protein [Mycobacterium sp.]